MKIGYSYIRFSSRQQRRGNSLARQIKATETWCARNGVTLDTSRDLKDLSTSAYSGAHRHRDNADKYALASFLALVQEGQIPKGSYLIVENLDRLTREQIVPAVNLFTGILMEGILIVQLMPVEQVFDEKADMPQLMMAVMELSRGNNESRVKSERVGSAWRERKTNAVASKDPVSAMCPKWLERVGAKKVGNKIRGGTYQPIPERVRVVRQIFRWSIDGHGIGAIARKLNDGGVKPFGERGEDHKHKDKPQLWQKSSVARVLKNRAVLGEYQPGEGSRRKAVGDPVPDYYPRVVEDHEFDDAQRAVRDRVGRRSDTRGEARNLFTGLLVSVDGVPYCYQGHRQSGGKGQYDYLLPSDCRHSSTRYVSMPYSAVERAILSHVEEITASDLATGEEAKLADRLGEIGRLIDAAKAKVTTFRDRIYADPANDTWPELERRAKQDVERLKREYDEVRINLSSPVVETVNEAQALIQLADDPEKRTRLKAKLAALVDRIGLHVWEDNYHVTKDKVKFDPKSDEDPTRMKVAWVQIRFKHSARVRNMVFSFTKGYGKVRPAKVHVYAVGDAPLAELEFTEDNAVDVENFFAQGEIGEPRAIT